MTRNGWELAERNKRICPSRWHACYARSALPVPFVVGEGEGTGSSAKPKVAHYSAQRGGALYGYTNSSATAALIGPNPFSGYFLLLIHARHHSARPMLSLARPKARPGTLQLASANDSAGGDVSDATKSFPRGPDRSDLEVGHTYAERDRDRGHGHGHTV